MSFRNVDGSPELLESGNAQFYIGILSVNSDQRQRGYSEESRRGCVGWDP